MDRVLLLAFHEVRRLAERVRNGELAFGDFVEGSK